MVGDSQIEKPWGLGGQKKSGTVFTTAVVGAKAVVKVQPLEEKNLGRFEVLLRH